MLTSISVASSIKQDQMLGARWRTAINTKAFSHFTAKGALPDPLHVETPLLCILKRLFLFISSPLTIFNSSSLPFSYSG
jgi:hypothetical protein